MEISETVEEVLLQPSGAHHRPETWLLYTYPNTSTDWKLDSQHCAENYWLCCLRKMYLPGRDAWLHSPISNLMQRYNERRELVTFQTKQNQMRGVSTFCSQKDRACRNCNKALLWLFASITISSGIWAACWIYLFSLVLCLVHEKSGSETIFSVWTGGIKPWEC